MDDVNFYEKSAERKSILAYFTILNLPIYMQTSRKDIFTLLTCKRKYITNDQRSKTTNIKLIFNGINNQIKEIQQNPLIINDQKVSLKVFDVAGDMQATNELMGVTRNACLDSCKYCSLTSGHFKDNKGIIIYFCYEKNEAFNLKLFFFFNYIKDWLDGNEINQPRALTDIHVFSSIIEEK